MTLTRRSLLGRGGAFVGLGVLPFVVDGKLCHLSPGEARARGIAFKSLTPAEVHCLEAFGDVLLPGAAKAGIAHFVDHHLSVPAAESLLMVRYLDVPPPYLDFYRAGLAALDSHSSSIHGTRFAGLAPEKANALVRAISSAPPAGWAGPPSPLFYFAVRNDAVDVVYGTEEGFEKLGIPYMPHIVPETKW